MDIGNPLKCTLICAFPCLILYAIIFIIANNTAYEFAYYCSQLATTRVTVDEIFDHVVTEAH